MSGAAGISHITFIVRDLEKSARIFTELLGAKEVYSSADDAPEGRSFSISHEKFFTLGGAWLALMQGEPLKERTYNHVAFEADAGDIAALKEKIAALGLEIKPGRPRIPGEGESVYFYDYDGHLFELHAGNFNDRLKKYFGK